MGLATRLCIAGGSTSVRRNGAYVTPPWAMGDDIFHSVRYARTASLRLKNTQASLYAALLQQHSSRTTTQPVQHLVSPFSGCARISLNERSLRPMNCSTDTSPRQRHADVRSFVLTQSTACSQHSVTRFALNLSCSFDSKSERYN